MPDDATNVGAVGGATGQTAVQTGVTATTGNETKPEVYTKEQVESRTSAAVNEALKKHRAEVAELMSAKDKDAEGKLAEIGARAEAAERYSAFQEEAMRGGIRNVKAAYAVARDGEYISARGKFDSARFRLENPEFFATAANANAGAGAGAPQPGGDVNAFIRQAAGIR